MGIVSSSRSGVGRGEPTRLRWWLVLWVLLAGLWASGEADPLWATSPTDEVGGGVGPVTDDHCPYRDRLDGTCRACPDFTHMRRGGRYQPKIEPSPGDPPCPADQLYYASYGGCRPARCNYDRSLYGYCLLPPPTTTEPPPPPPGVPRNVSVTAGLGSLTVSWQRAASGASPTGWEIYYSYRANTGAARTVSGVHTVNSGTVPAGGVTLKGLAPGEVYTVRVRAKNGTVVGPYSPTVTATTLAPAATLVGLEVTQGLQDWEGSIDLVKGKTTVVRVFLEPFNGRDTQVHIKLEAVRKRGSTETVVDTEYPVNRDGYVVLPSGLTATYTAQSNVVGRRHELGASANFELTDPEWIGNKTYTANTPDLNITYRLVVEEAILCKEAISPDNACRADLTFEPVKTPKVRMVGIRTSTEDPPTTAELEEQALRIESLMPIPRLDYELLTLRATVEPVSIDNDWIEVLVELLEERYDHNNASAYLGVIKSTTTSGMSGVLSVVAAWDIGDTTKDTDLEDDRNIGSHEFGHVIGERHSAYYESSKDKKWTICAEPNNERAVVDSDVVAYPYMWEVTKSDGGKENWAALGLLRPQATIDNEMWGFDTRFIDSGFDELAIINPREVFSIMSYCKPYKELGIMSQGLWIDAHHHRRFMDRTNEINWDLGPGVSAGSDSSPSPQTVFQGYYTVSADDVSGSSAGGATVLPVQTLKPGSRLGVPSGGYTLEFLDGDRNVLRSVSFGTYTVAVESSNGASESEVWVVPVVEPSGWASYRILEPPASGSGAGGAVGSGSSRTVLVEVSRSANAPVVSVTAPTAGQVLSGDEVSFSWTGSDADGDALSYVVDYSDDGGTSYETIAVGHKSTSLTVDRASLAGSTTARVKVTASDGTRTASAESAVFAVSQNAPEVFIHSPDPNTIGGPEALVLDATAYDTEDGRLDTSAIQWASGTDGNLGTGGHVVVYPEDLAPGLHWLTATVTDSAGAAGYAELTWVNAAPIEETPPEPPAGAAAAGGNRSVTITWDSPVAWLVTTYYQYRYRPASGAWTQWAVLHPGNRTHTISGLSSGTHYEIEMRTATDTAVSDTVGVFAATDAAIPAAPVGLAATGGAGWIDLTWNNPSDSSITSYQFRERPSFDDDWWCWTPMWASGQDTVAHRVHKLSSGTAYRIQVRAINSTGAGPAAEASATTSPAAAPPASAPAAPAGLVGTGADQSIALSWNDPADSSIIEYQFREVPDNETNWRCWRRIYNSTHTTTSHNMPGITNNLRYQVQLRALNAAGASKTSRTAATPTPGP